MIKLSFSLEVTGDAEIYWKAPVVFDGICFRQSLSWGIFVRVLSGSRSFKKMIFKNYYLCCSLVWLLSNE